MAIASRILSVLLGIIILAVGVFLIFSTLGILGPSVLQHFQFDFVELIGDYNYTAFGFVLLILGILIIAFFSSRGTAKKEGGSIVSFSEMGELRISFKAIENMVITASKRIKGLRDVNTRISSTEQGLIIYLRIHTLPDLPIPSMVSELQEKVREYVEDISGATVSEVKVLVEDIAQEKIQKSVH